MVWPERLLLDCQGPLVIEERFLVVALLPHHRPYIYQSGSKVRMGWPKPLLLESQGALIIPKGLVVFCLAAQHYTEVVQSCRQLRLVIQFFSNGKRALQIGVSSVVFALVLGDDSQAAEHARDQLLVAFLAFDRRHRLPSPKLGLLVFCLRRPDRNQTLKCARDDVIVPA